MKLSPLVEVIKECKEQAEAANDESRVDALDGDATYVEEQSEIELAVSIAIGGNSMSTPNKEGEVDENQYLGSLF